MERDASHPNRYLNRMQDPVFRNWKGAVDEHPSSQSRQPAPLAQARNAAPRNGSRGGQALERGGSLEPAIEKRAREFLGLDDLEALPKVLPVRAEQLWRLDGFASDIPFTNTMFIPMGPAADIGLLYEAIATVVRRHEALRTRLTLDNGRPIQVAEDWKADGLEVVDILRADLTEDRPGRKSPIAEFSQGAMDLYAQDGFRCRAFRDENQEITLGILAHGFFSDAWSSQLLLREVRAVTSALKTREAAILKPVLQYGEYAQAQRRSLDRDLASHLTYWNRKLSGMPPARLPYNHRKETGRRGRSYFFIDEEFVAPLTAFSLDNRISLTMVLLAAYQLALARWSGQTEITSAAYTADRIKPEFQNTFGFLVTNLPVCSRIDRAATFRVFLADLAKEFYGGYSHRELSCEVYDAIFSPPKPFCATVFNFVPLQKNFSDGELLSLPSFPETIIGPDASRPALYREIYLGLTQYPNGILGKLFYNADLFTPDGIEIFINHFRKIVRDITADPDVKLRELLD